MSPRARGAATLPRQACASLLSYMYDATSISSSSLSSGHDLGCAGTGLTTGAQDASGVLVVRVTMSWKVRTLPLIYEANIISLLSSYSSY